MIVNKVSEQEEEEPIQYSEDSSDDAESDNETKAKTKKIKKKTLFSESFLFDTDETDPWNDYFLKKKNRKRKLDPDADIKKVKNSDQSQLKKSKVVEVVEIKEEDDDDSDSDGDHSDDDLVVESERAADTLNIRKKDVKKKEKQNKRKIKKKKNNNNDDQEDEEVNDEFFENGSNLVTDLTFHEMNLSRPLLKAIDNLGYNNPTPIQCSTIPLALLGRDICGCAATGTGKTAAFMLPILERLIFKPKEDPVTRVLVLVPTRELGVQVFQVSKQLSQYSIIDLALSVGGLDLRSQEANLRKSPDIVIATPGRLIDHLKNTPGFSLDRIEILVLDEADRMLDEYFAEQMNEIIKQCSRSRQTMLFSATMSSQVQDLAAVSLNNPAKIFVNSNTSVAKNLRQEFVKIRKSEEGARESVLAYLVCRTFHEQCIVFIQTKFQCHRLHVLMSLLGINSGELHGNLSQPQRLDALDNFKQGNIGVLLCTDLAARGLDIPHVKTVINFTLPGTYQNYVHRVGRTARAGHCGRSISLVGEQEYKALKNIKKSSNTVVYERQPNRGVLEKYAKKINRIEARVKEKLRQEKEIKEVKAMEHSLNTMKKKLDATPGQRREWFQNKTERLADKKRQTVVEKPKKGKKNNPQEQHMSAPERRMQREVDIAQKIAKRAKKGNKVRSSGGNDVVEVTTKGKKAKKKSLFENDLTKTDRKSVKKFRAGPSYQEKKDYFAKKNPGKKFNPKKKNK